MRSAQQRLQDMLEAIENVQRHVERGREHFMQDEVLQGYVLHQLMILGEAAYQMPDDLRTNHPEVAWRPIAALRHILVHGYFTTDLDAIWVITEKDLPHLKTQIEQLLGKTVQ